jgi:hypothetical protein
MVLPVSLDLRCWDGPAPVGSLGPKEKEIPSLGQGLEQELGLLWDSPSLPRSPSASSGKPEL